jgi:large subunit ribosomal protein L30e
MNYMDIDLNKVLRNVVKTGTVFIGSKQTIKAVDNQKAKIVILSSNCPKDIEDRIAGKVPLINYPGIGIELGTTCDKPFSIAAMAVIEPGESDIMAVKAQ